MANDTPFGQGGFNESGLGNTPFFTTKTIIDKVLRATGHTTPSSETEKRASLLDMANNAYQEVIMGRHWRWLYGSESIDLFAPNEGGSISLTNGSSTVTGLGTAFSANDIGRFFVATGFSQVMRVISVESTTQLTLEAKWPSDDVTDGEYKLYKAIYKLPKEAGSILSISIEENFGRKLVPIGRQEMRVKQQYDPSFEITPYCYTLDERNPADDIQEVEFFPLPDKDYTAQVDFEYRIFSLCDSDDSLPLVPDQFRVVLYYHVLSQFFRYLNDPNGESAALRDYQKIYARLCNDTELTDSRVRFKNNRNYRLRAFRNARRFGGFQDRTTFGRFS